MVEKLKEKNEKFYDRLNLKFHSKREIGTWHFLYVCDDASGVTTEPNKPDFVSEFHKLVDDMLEKVRGDSKDEYLSKWRAEVYQHDVEQTQSEENEAKEEQQAEKFEGVVLTIKDHELIRNISKNRDVKEGVEPDRLQKLLERNKAYGELRHAVNNDHNLLKRLFRKHLKLSITTPDLKNESDLLDVLYHDLKLRDGDVWSVKQKSNDYLKRWPETLMCLEESSATEELKKSQMFEKGYDGMRDSIKRTLGLSREKTVSTAPVASRKKESVSKGETKNAWSALMDNDME